MPQRRVVRLLSCYYKERNAALTPFALEGRDQVVNSLS